MFERNTVVWFYTVSPVHMGSGSAIGMIDNPIQREVHTNYPYFAGSGIKGAVRHNFQTLGGDKAVINKIFGPDSGSENLYAGAVSFSDAQLVLFPIRSMRHGFVYATSPQILARTQRLINSSSAEGGNVVSWDIETVDDGHCIVHNERLLSDDKKIHLELFEYRKQETSSSKAIARDIAKCAIDGSKGNGFFKNKIEEDLVILSDGDFRFFVETAIVVEPHVRIDERTGSASSRGLFYTENLPPESLLISQILASKTRSGDENADLDSACVMSQMKCVLDGKTIQIGGDSTTGRGLVSCRFMGL